MNATGIVAGPEAHAILPMLDVLIIVKDNSYGLTRDARLLANELDRAGLSSSIVGIGERGPLGRMVGRRIANIAVHIERAFPNWRRAANRHYLIPNQERFPRRHLGRLGWIDRVLAKTHHAEAIFRDRGVPTEYLGFVSEDRRMATAERDWTSFFHLAGANTLKGTEDILALWRAHPEWPELVLVQKAKLAPDSVPANVRLIARYVDDAELMQLQNRYGVHLCPSRSEGWGHHIVEAMSCGALVLTTDAPPMNELVTPDTGVPVPFARTEPRHLGTSYFVDIHALEGAIERVMAMADQDKRTLGDAARSRYEAICTAFRRNVSALFDAKSIS